MFAKDDTNENTYNSLKHNISIGLFDDKAGLSLFSYSLNQQLNQNNELFTSVGTALFLHTASLGLKHYHRKSKVSIYSIFSIKTMFSMDSTFGYDIINIITSSISLEYSFMESFKINLGGVGCIDAEEDNYEFWGFPFIALNFQF